MDALTDLCTNFKGRGVIFLPKTIAEKQTLFRKFAHTCSYEIINFLVNTKKGLFLQTYP
jgi:hypothetical protein